MPRKPVKKTTEIADFNSGYTIGVRIIKSRKNPRVLILRASGEFLCHESLTCGEEFFKKLSKAFASNRTRFVLNLGGVTSLDAVGICSLIRFVTQCNEYDVMLVWCESKQKAEEVLRTAHLIDVVPYYETEAEAVDSFRKFDLSITPK